MIPSLHDYGGNQHGRRVKRTKENAFSHVCRDCNKMQYIPKRELYRAARPRCYHCGGTLLETEATTKKIKEKEDLVAEAKGKPREKFFGIFKRAEIKCPGCYLGFDSKAFATHIKNAGFCRRETISNGLTVEYDPYTFIRYTFRYIRMEKTNKRWAVLADTVDGKTLYVKLYRRCDAEALCAAGNSREGDVDQPGWRMASEIE